MIALWISAALVSAAAAALIIQRAARAARSTEREDPATTVYRRQLNEIDELAERGLLLDEERRSAHAEAARRLLATTDDTPSRDVAKGGRGIVLAVAALAPLVAIGVYLAVGSPRTPDQPFARRVSAWRAADPSSLTADELVAVLQLINRQRPNDPRGYYFLARAQMASGDAFSAIHSLRHAIDLAPRDGDLWTGLGEMEMAQAGGDATPEALNAFRQAIQADPAAPAPRYFLARARIAGGDVAGGVADWKALDQTLAANDPRRQGLEQEIAVVERTHALPPAPAQTAEAEPDPRAFIRGMVETLAARLKAQPDDPAGWARLVRSYAVLGDAPRQAAALATARDLFKSRPADLRLVEQAASRPQ